MEESQYWRNAFGHVPLSGLGLSMTVSNVLYSPPLSQILLVATVRGPSTNGREVSAAQRANIYRTCIVREAVNDAQLLLQFTTLAA